jgi:acyl carrier protein
MDKITHAVYEVLRESYYDVDESTSQGSSLVGDLDMDSIELVQFGMDLESKLDISIPDGTITGAMTVGEVIEAIRKLTTT